MTAYVYLTFIVYVVYQGVTQTAAQTAHLNIRRHQSLGAHVDLPNQHGNTLPHPVIHRENNHRPPNSPPSHHVGVHVDLTNQHGNTLPHPVVHRENHHRPHNGQTSNRRVAAQPGEVHVEIPKQHPIIPRASVGHAGHQNHGGEVHVDLPFQHGNTRSHPVIHRTGGASRSVPAAQRLPKSREFHHPGHRGGSGSGGEHAHVDHPGQHGNTAPFPVIHRPGSAHSGSSTTGGQHANLLPLLGISRNSVPGLTGGRTIQSTGLQGQGMSHSGLGQGQLGVGSQSPFTPITEPREFGIQGGMTPNFQTQPRLGPPALNAPVTGGGAFVPLSMLGQQGGPMMSDAGMSGVPGGQMMPGMGMGDMQVGQMMPGAGIGGMQGGPMLPGANMGGVPGVQMMPGIGMDGMQGGQMMPGAGMGGMQGGPMLPGMGMGMGMGMGGLGGMPLPGMGPFPRLQFITNPVLRRRMRRRFRMMRRMRRLENMTELLQTTLATLLRRL